MGGGGVGRGTGREGGGVKMLPTFYLPHSRAGLA